MKLIIVGIIDLRHTLNEFLINFGNLLVRNEKLGYRREGTIFEVEVIL
ncbi:hypothetical protein [Sedimentibacter sp.]|nr:hypothetical protein [Sedimentibacter sp.]